MTSVSVFSSITPPILTKVIKMNSEDKLEKIPCAKMVAGKYQKMQASSLEGLDELLSELDSNQAVAYGVNDADEALVVIKSKVANHPGTIARSKEFFQFTDDQAIFMIDYDPEDGKPPLSDVELHAAVIEAMPELTDVKMLWRPSASSCIYHADTNDQIVGISGQRLYFIVDKGTEIPRIGEILGKRLFLADRGWIFISKSGAMLIRSIVDTTVWQGEGLDFAAGAVCTEPLERIPAASKFFGSDDVLDSSTVNPLTKDEERQYRQAVDAAKQAVRPAQQTIIEKYITESVDALVGSGAPANERAHAEKTIRAATEQHFLTPDFVLILDNYGAMSVSEILNDKSKYHRQTLADPLEPDYGGGKGKAMLFLTGTRPIVHSFAHGGRKFRLRGKAQSIRVGAGQFEKSLDAVATLLGKEPDIFCNDTGIILVDEGLNGVPRQQVMNIATIAARAAFIADYYKERETKNGPVPIEADVPERVVSTIASRKDRTPMRKLADIVRAPTLRPDGSILQKPGYDKKTQLLLLMDEGLPTIPDHPTREQAIEAMCELWGPVSQFDYATPLDEASMRAALLCAVVRRTLPTAPGVKISAATAGSGKTKIAKALSILAGGDASITAYSHSKEELRKSLTSALLAGEPCVIYDNVTGHVQSDLLCATLTSPTHSDRILGGSTKRVMSTRSLFIFTGNNIETIGDLSRRVLPVNLDPDCEDPWDRSFSFDPVQVVAKNRLKLVVAALTVLRAYISAGKPRMVNSHTGSFEEWSELVRQAVIWLGYEDPQAGFSANYVADPDTEYLRGVLHAWKDEFGTGFTETAKLSIAINSDNAASPFYNAVATALGESPTQASFSKWLGYKKGRWIDGFRLDQPQTKNKKLHGKRGWILQEK